MVWIWQHFEEEKFKKNYCLVFIFGSLKGGSENIRHLKLQNCTNQGQPLLGERYFSCKETSPLCHGQVIYCFFGQLSFQLHLITQTGMAAYLSMYVNMYITISPYMQKGSTCTSLVPSINNHNFVVQQVFTRFQWFKTK